MTMTTGAEAVLMERARQTRKGYDAAHDDEFGAATTFELAADAYEWNDAGSWPWKPDLFHPRERIFNLVRAGAMMLAAEQWAERNGSVIAQRVESWRLRRLNIEAELDRLFIEAAW